MIRVPELDALCEAIANNSALRVASHADAERYRALERRRCQIGGMLELARRLDDHRLVRFLEAHKDALGRQMERE
ncbi:MAG: hypothetical protein ACREVO_08865 [Steroidobacteraceae bacterium]